MKSLKLFVLVLTAALLVAAPALAAKADKPAKEKGAKGAILKGEFAIMASELKLTDDQKAQLAEKVKAKEEAAAKWDAANGEKLKALMETAKKAKEAGDKAASKRAAEELKALRDDQEKATADAEAAIMGALTPEQKAQWDGFKVYRVAMMRFKKCNLTDEQTAKVKAACQDAAKSITPETKAKATQELYKKIEETILTAEQKPLLEKKPAADKAADKADKKAEKAAKK